MNALLETTDLCKEYQLGKDSRVEVLKKVSLTIQAGEFLSVIKVAAKTERVVCMMDGRIVGEQHLGKFNGDAAGCRSWDSGYHHRRVLYQLKSPYALCLRTDVLCHP